MNSIAINCSHHRLVPVAELVPNPRNPNKHGPEQIGLLAKIIAHQGWRSPIVVSKRSGFVVTGHGRLQAAQQLEAMAVPVDFQDFASEADEWAHLIADNRIAELAEIDPKGLAGLLSELKGNEVDMDLTGFDSDELGKALLALTEETEVDAEAQLNRAVELQRLWGTERGQIWQLGEHRLMCGDSTQKRDVEALLARERPHLMVTDPPYGVSYDPAWREGCDLGVGQRSKGKVLNDDRADWTEAWKLFTGDVAYVWHGGLHSHTVAENLMASGFQLRAQIVWVKQHFVLSRGDYHWQHEPCWYAVRKGRTGRWSGDRTQVTTWEIANNNSFGNPNAEETVGHGTQKPVECMARPIRNNSEPGELVYEPFSGSGTTLIACEQLNRRCRALEISPGYVAVALQRFTDATGKEPKLV